MNEYKIISFYRFHFGLNSVNIKKKKKTMRPHVNVVRSAPMKIKNLIIIHVGLFKPGFTSVREVYCT